MNASKAFLVNNSGMNGGGGGAFWDGPSGKVIISLEWLNNGQTKSQNTGIILAPTPGVWSMYQWQFDGIRLQQNYSLRAALTTGFILFSDIAGTPDVRFGTGLGDPGFGNPGSPSAQFTESFSMPYTPPFIDSSDVAPGFGQSSGPLGNMPIAILSTGEVVFSMYDASGDANSKAARGVLTISPQLPALSFPPVV
jgi:hypothetical protein